MTLSCYCDDGDLDWWYEARPVTTLYAKRWRRCRSCKERINVGDECMPLTRWRTPNPGSVAERIYNDEEPLATWYLCERCAGLYESLDSLGFCINMPADLRYLCREYAQMQRDAGVFRGQMVMAQQ